MARAARYADAGLAGTACALLAGGAAALMLRAYPGQQASAMWMSALTLATMIAVPSLMSRVSNKNATLAIATTLIATLSAMSVIPAFLSGTESGTALAALISITGAALLAYALRAASRIGKPATETQRHQNSVSRNIHTASTSAALALLAGLSSGTLARFQIYGLCGAGGIQPAWQLVLPLAAVCAIAAITDRSDEQRTLIALYATRAVLIAAMALANDPTFAPLAAKLFLILDCLTIPALMKRGKRGKRGESTSCLNGGCTGAAHHIGMIVGATLSTTPYFFGDGYIVLYLLSALANMGCAALLAATRQKKNTQINTQTNTANSHTLANRSDEHEVRAGMNDSLVTYAECATSRMLRGHEPFQAGGPA